MLLLHHYTDLNGLAGVAASGTLWATNFLHVNDKTEYFYAWEVIQRHAMHYAIERVPEDMRVPGKADFQGIAAQATNQLREVLKASSDPYGQLYMTSFARGSKPDHDERGILTLWDRYTSNAGYCLQFDDSDVRFDAERRVDEGQLWHGRPDRSKVWR